MKNNLFNSANPFLQGLGIVIFILIGLFFFQVILSLLGILLALGIAVFAGIFIFYLGKSIFYKMNHPKETFKNPWKEMKEAILNKVMQFQNHETHSPKKNSDSFQVCPHCGHVETSDQEVCSECHQKI